MLIQLTDISLLNNHLIERITNFPPLHFYDPLKAFTMTENNK